jgi:hypothetical protein
VRPVGRRERAVDVVEELHPQGRLLVDEVGVGELREEEPAERVRLHARRGRAQVVAEDVSLAGGGLEPVVAVAVEDRLLVRGARARRRGRGEAADERRDHERGTERPVSEHPDSSHGGPGGRPPRELLTTRGQAGAGCGLLTAAVPLE